MWEKLGKYAALLILAVLVAASLWGYSRYSAYETQLADLRNQVAARDKTVEELRNVYTKLATENDGLKTSNRDLDDLYKKTKQDLIAETQAKVFWKGKYEYTLSHSPVAPGVSAPDVVPGPSAQPQLACTPEALPYVSVQDIGLLKLTLGTLTKDPNFTQRLTVEPGSRPLVLTVDFTRDRKKQWHTHVVSSDERIGVDLGVSSVNIEPLEEHWYERVKLSLDLGVGSAGPLGGVGAVYEFGRWELGPKVWASPSGIYYGATTTWAPFKQAP